MPRGHAQVKSGGVWRFPIKSYTKRNGVWELAKFWFKADGQWFEHGLQAINTISRVTTPFSTSGNFTYSSPNISSLTPASISISAPANHIIQGLQVGVRVNEISDDDLFGNSHQVRVRAITGQLQAADWGEDIILDGPETLLASCNTGIHGGTSSCTADAGVPDHFMLTRVVFRYGTFTQSSDGDDDFGPTQSRQGVDLYGKTSSAFQNILYTGDIIMDGSVGSGSIQNTFRDTSLVDMGATRMIRKITFVEAIIALPVQPMMILEIQALLLFFKLLLQMLMWS